MNTIVKTFMFFAFILIQNKLGAQIENSSSVQEVAIKNTALVNINNDVNHKSFTSIGSEITTNKQPFFPQNGVKNSSDSQNSSNVELILLQVIDSKSMDTKPE